MLHYQTYGSPGQPPLCFVHGFMGSSCDWTPIVEALTDEAYCLTVDLPGHGQSLNRPSYLYSMEGATQALADVLDDAGIDRCSLVGYSMGGRVALYFSLFHPTRVRRLVLESTSPGLPSAEERAERQSLDEERAQRIQEDLPGFLEEWYRMPLFASLARHGLIEEMVATRSANDPDEIARALRGLSPGVQPSLWDRLCDLSVPTLVLTGALDDKYTGVTARAARRIETAERVVVPKAGHNVHAERPQAFLAQLVRFLETT
jgi:2-succinyl-6-hydroxy-2,4-cyclohexadiene-1-carboxylate synthase